MIESEVNHPINDLLYIVCINCIRLISQNHRNNLMLSKHALQIKQTYFAVYRKIKLIFYFSANQ